MHSASTELIVVNHTVEQMACLDLAQQIIKVLKS